MEPVFIDLHIHISDNPDDLNLHYDLDVLKNKIEEIAEGGVSGTGEFPGRPLNYKSRRKLGENDKQRDHVSILDRM